MEGSRASKFSEKPGFNRRCIMDVSLIFGIIFTLIVIGALLVFGWDLIADFFGIGGESQVLRTIENLGKKVSEIYRLAEGSSEQFSLSFPKEYRLCFFNSSYPEERFYSDKSRNWDPDSTTKYSINASHYNAWYYKGENDAAGSGKRIPYLEINAEPPPPQNNNNFCALGGSKIYIVKKWEWVEVEPV